MIERKAKLIRSFLKVSPVSFGAFDILKNEIVYTSGLIEEILGYSNQQMVKFSRNNFQDILYPDDFDRVQGIKRKVLDSAPGELINLTTRLIKSNGTIASVRIHYLVFERDDDGNPLKYSTALEDISELVTLESELADKVRILKEISFKNSHDLRAPVASILGLVDVLKDSGFENEQHKKVFEHLQCVVNKLDSVIHEINNSVDL